MKKNAPVLLFLTFLSLLLPSCYSTNTSQSVQPLQTPVSEDYSTADFQVPKSDINLAEPLRVSAAPQDVALCEDIKRTIAESSYSNARWGIFAASLKDGRVICENDGRKLFNPASIEKVLTSIVALDTLGVSFTWKTGIYANSQINGGTLNGNLYLYGTGAPDFDTVALENLVNQLQAKGLKSVNGNIIGDESFFRGDNIGDGWTWNELQWYYGAEASALTFNENKVFVGIEKGMPKSSSEFVNVSLGQPQTGTNSNAEGGGIKRGLSNNEFVVWGSGKDFGGQVAVNNPALIAAKNLRAILEKRGIAVSGETKSADWKSGDKLDAANAVELASVQSQTLGEAVKRMNKRSDNLYAELILRAVGGRFYNEAPRNEDRPGEIRGNDAAGAAYIKKWLGDKKVAIDEIQIHDGSGLSRLDFVTPESFVRALIYAAQSANGQVFADSLPIAATDGTLGGRLAPAKGRIIAKTGTVTYVNSLAGYASNPNGETYAFSIICNNATKKNDAVRVVDQIALLIAGQKRDEKNGNLKSNSNFSVNSVNANNSKNANNSNAVFNMNKFANSGR